MVRTCLICGHQTEQEIAVCPIDGTLLRQTAADPFVGSTFLEKYEVTEPLGKGGMSAVYKARHVLMDRWVAIKVLRQELVNDGLSLRRFQQESKAVSLLKHPNVMTVHDFGLTPDGIPYLIMDYLEGTTLSSLIRSEGQLNPARTVFLFSQACDALAHAHSKGVVHRDLKPSNLMVLVEEDEIEVLKLVDFGIAKLLEMSNISSPQLTSTGEIFGSPYYMSPEQCNGRQTDGRSDIYSLGCCIYECLTGVVPFKGETAIETICKHISDTPPSFQDVRPDLEIPPQLEAVVLKAIAKDPDERFQTMMEFDTALRHSFPDFAVGVTSQRMRPSMVAARISQQNLQAVNNTLLEATVPPALVSPQEPCRSCGKDNPVGLSFCVFCGESTEMRRALAAQTWKCETCNFENSQGGEFCLSCGTALKKPIAKPAEIEAIANAPSRRAIAPLPIALAVILLAAGIFGVLSMSQKKETVSPPTQNETVPPQPTETYSPIQVNTPWVTVNAMDENKNIIGGKALKKGSLFTYAAVGEHDCYLYLLLKESAEPHGTLVDVPADNWFTKGTTAFVCRTGHDRPELLILKADMKTSPDFLVPAGKPGTDQLFIVASADSRLPWLEEVPAEKVHDVADAVIEKATKYLGNTKYPHGIEIPEKAIAGNFNSADKPQKLYVSVVEMKHE